MRKAVLFCFVVLFVLPKVSFARGDKVIPQVADGQGVIRTKFDLMNIGAYEEITKAKLLFFKSDGRPWVLATSAGTGSEFSIKVRPLETLRIETLGQSSPLTSGYAILRDQETQTSSFTVDYRLGISVFYEILSGTNIVDAVSVTAGQPTISCSFPVEIDKSKNLFTGFAIVNLANSSNRVDFQIWASASPSSEQVQSGAIDSFTLGPGEQRAEFLSERLFPGLTSFKGLAECFAQKPVALLALLQIPAALGVQYATLVPIYKDDLRRNGYVFLRQVAVPSQPTTAPLYMPLDVDIPVADYLLEGRDEEGFPWDVVYETQTKDKRRLLPINGATLAVVGARNAQDFDSLSLGQLQAMTYTTNPIDLSGDPRSAFQDYAFAVKTGLGRYAKVRIASIVQAVTKEGDIYYDLALEVYVYR